MHTYKSVCLSAGAPINAPRMYISLFVSLYVAGLILVCALFTTVLNKLAAMSLTKVIAERCSVYAFCLYWAGNRSALEPLPFGKCPVQGHGWHK